MTGKGRKGKHLWRVRRWSKRGGGGVRGSMRSTRKKLTASLGGGGKTSIRKREEDRMKD